MVASTHSTQSHESIVRAGSGFMQLVGRGQHLRITDLHGNQAADTLFFAAEDLSERYCAANTIRHQRNLYLTRGSQLRSNRNRTLLTLVEDTCGRHDTLGGACASESNIVRYGFDRRLMHNCRDTFLTMLLSWDHVLDKSYLAPNINFFMNVPVTTHGDLTFVDGISEAGKFVELRAETNVVVLISNCPQLNNPCNAYNPTPIKVEIFSA